MIRRAMLLLSAIDVQNDAEIELIDHNWLLDDRIFFCYIQQHLFALQSIPFSGESAFNSTN
jgi:hypothetical protein